VISLTNNCQVHSCRWRAPTGVKSLLIA
jgi:hypothetical protein